MRVGWAIVAGLALGGGLAWWLGRAPAGKQAERQPQAAAARAAAPALYRWRDDAGTLQVTQTPPKGRFYERVPLESEGGNRITPLH